ncbi:MAG: hypothetical protein HQM16_08875 [Deltaproteobacteria bacterium]|nr:hypothetical protein [Deltaproteobacteria bacterium]
MKQKNLRVSVYLMTLCYVFGAVTVSPAAVRHPFQEKRTEAKIEEKAQNIPLYQGAPERPFKIIRDVRVDGMTKKKEKIYSKLKARAYKLKGDAVVDVYCDTIKTFSVSCYGTVVKWE